MTTESSAANGSANPLLGGLDWAQPFSEAPLNAYTAMCREALGATARCLQAQSEFVQRLAECTSPSDVIGCQSEFVRKSMEMCFDEGQTMLGTLQRNMPVESYHS
ncbi:phasin family protein [Acuticoccus mangrovi]|uniref:Phasin family protein n=1 Tax=Acuticoccus mangrovi TaxID=2796142 RepID=A0A934ISS2_9HYPH|nr:phasin family protein [Acuticoccus mangrovi]MBJ3777532.1 phasin family protein [Acuticoccus mangrovi]